jgi:hypothetical protein
LAARRTRRSEFAASRRPHAQLDGEARRRAGEARRSNGIDSSSTAIERALDLAFGATAANLAHGRTRIGVRTAIVVPRGHRLDGIDPDVEGAGPSVPK